MQISSSEEAEVSVITNNVLLHPAHSEPILPTSSGSASPSPPASTSFLSDSPYYSPTAINRLNEEENRKTHATYLSFTLPDDISESDLSSHDCYASDSSTAPSSLLTAEAAALRIDCLDESLYGKVDRFGFIILSDDKYSKRDHAKLEEKRKEKEASRSMKWVEMLFVLEQQSNVSLWPSTHRKFLSRLIKGIPDCVRTKVWSIFLLKGQAESPRPFSELYTHISGFERQIDLDIERTLRDHVLFKPRFGQAQVSLFKILVAYSNLDPCVGYCQGMSTVAAFLLLYFDEEVLQRNSLRTLYQAGFPLLFESFFVQERLVLKYMPDLAKHLVSTPIHAIPLLQASFGITTSVYATKWYLTLFLGFPFSLATRIWDLFLFYGFDILIVVAVAMLKYFEGKLMHLEYEPCMQFLSRLPDTPINDDRLVKLTMQFWRKYAESDKEGRKGFQAFREAYHRQHDK